jgi:hypothetical protein
MFGITTTNKRSMQIVQYCTDLQFKRIQQKLWGKLFSETIKSNPVQIVAGFHLQYFYPSTNELFTKNNARTKVMREK